MKTPYKLFQREKPYAFYFITFGSKCSIQNNDEQNLDKFDIRSDGKTFVVYSSSNKAYKLYEKNFKIIKERIHVATCHPYKNFSSVNKMGIKDTNVDINKPLA